MKALLVLVLAVLALVSPSFAESPRPVKGRTLTELKIVPTRVLQRSISPWFYKSLLVSPLEGWVVVEAQLSGANLYGERVVRSDLGGAYDSLALKMARELKIAGDNQIDSQIRFTRVQLHVLIYEIADGTMALSFASLDRAGADQLDYYGCARLAVLKNNGKWVTIKGPESLEGKGLEVRAPGAANDLASLIRLDKVNFNGR